MNNGIIKQVNLNTEVYDLKASYINGIPDKLDADTIFVFDCGSSTEQIEDIPNT